MRRAVLLGISSFAIVLFACGLGACGGGDGAAEPDATVVPPLPDASAGSFPVNGRIMGEGARPGDFNVLFTNTDNVGSLHAYGSGRSTDGSRFELDMPQMLPGVAQIGGTTGVGHVVMVELDEPLPELPQSSDGRRIIGVSADYMLIYRTAPFVTQFSWEDQFEVGWSCGACVRGLPNQPDTLQPIACSEVVVSMGAFANQDACNVHN